MKSFQDAGFSVYVFDVLLQDFYCAPLAFTYPGGATEISLDLDVSSHSGPAPFYYVTFNAHHSVKTQMIKSSSASLNIPFHWETHHIICHFLWISIHVDCKDQYITLRFSQSLTLRWNNSTAKTHHCSHCWQKTDKNLYL